MTGLEWFGLLGFASILGSFIWPVSFCRSSGMSGAFYLVPVFVSAIAQEERDQTYDPRELDRNLPAHQVDRQSVERPIQVHQTKYSKDDRRYLHK